MPLPLNPAQLLAGIALLNAIAKPVIAWAMFEMEAPNATSFLCATGGLFYWIRHSQSHSLRTWQSGCLILSACLVAVPMAFAAWSAASLIAVTCLTTQGLSRREKAGLLVLLAASMRTPVAEGTMILLAEPLLQFDGAFANLIGGLIGGGGSLNENMIVGAEGHAVLVMSGCASFANVSNALLIWFTVAMLVAVPTRRHLWTVAAGLTLAIVSINAVRLGGMTVSREAYHWIHDGNGAVIAEIAMTTAILAALTVTVKRFRHV